MKKRSVLWAIWKMQIKNHNKIPYYPRQNNYLIIINNNSNSKCGRDAEKKELLHTVCANTLKTSKENYQSDFFLHLNIISLNVTITVQQFLRIPKISVFSVTTLFSLMSYFCSISFNWVRVLCKVYTSHCQSSNLSLCFNWQMLGWKGPISEKSDYIL
jgi:hypothetical protein